MRRLYITWFDMTYSMHAIWNSLHQFSHNMWFVLSLIIKLSWYHDTWIWTCQISILNPVSPISNSLFKCLSVSMPVHIWFVDLLWCKSITQWIHPFTIVIPFLVCIHHYWSHFVLQTRKVEIIIDFLFLRAFRFFNFYACILEKIHTSLISHQHFV